MIQNVSFGHLHINDDAKVNLRRLAQSPEDIEALSEACETINKASGDRDVYLNAYRAIQYYYTVSIDDAKGKSFQQVACNERLNNSDSFYELAEAFVSENGIDSESSARRSTKSIDDIFDIYA